MPRRPPLPIAPVPLHDDDVPEVLAFWRESTPSLPMDEATLRERLFLPPDSSPATRIAVRDARGIAAVSFLAPPTAAPPAPSARPAETGASAPVPVVGGIRWFGVRPDARFRGLGDALLGHSLDRLAEAGAEVFDFLCTPPYYLRPGVEIGDTATIAWLLRRGFEHYRSNFNMTLEMDRFDPPGEEAIFGERDGYRVRRATPADREAFGDYARREWTEGWRVEGTLGLSHDPVSLFLATRDDPAGGEEIAGFAVYEANQCLGCFGPTGVSPEHRGRDLGRRLLLATLIDMKRLGRERVEIGWVGPVDFYFRAVGAVLGPAFWGMRKKKGIGKRE